MTSLFLVHMLEHRSDNRNRHDALSCCLRIRFIRKPVPTFRSNAVDYYPVESGRKILGVLQADLTNSGIADGSS